MVYLGQWLRFARVHIIRLGTFGVAFFLCSCSSDTLRFSKSTSPSAERTRWASYERLNSGLTPPESIGVRTPSSYEDASNRDASQSDVYAAPPTTDKRPPTQRFFALSSPPEPQTQEVTRETLSPPSAGSDLKKVNFAPVTPNKTLADAPKKMESGPKGWTSEGGTWVLTSKGDTVKRLSERYGVPGSVIENMNALPHDSSLKPGMNIIIPVYRGEPSQLVQHQKESKFASLNEPRASVAPTSISGNVYKPVAPLPSSEQPSPERAGIASAVPVTPQAESKQKSVIGAPALAAVPPLQEGGAPASSPSTPSGALRWPVRGRVITQFNVGGNEGINIAVPAGTPVKAAEDGVVAYAGEELKGYGKLILVRHTNGLISAYAHNSSLLVAKGDKVRRGQNISLSGQTGSVSSPQLHFEVRQGAVPVDPIPRLESHNNF